MLERPLASPLSPAINHLTILIINGSAQILSCTLTPANFPSSDEVVSLVDCRRQHGVNILIPTFGFENRFNGNDVCMFFMTLLETISQLQGAAEQAGNNYVVHVQLHFTAADILCVC